MSVRDGVSLRRVLSRRNDTERVVNGGDVTTDDGTKTNWKPLQRREKESTWMKSNGRVLLTP